MLLYCCKYHYPAVLYKPLEKERFGTKLKLINEIFVISYS